MGFLFLLSASMYLFYSFHSHKAVFNEFSQSNSVRYGLLLIPILALYSPLFKELGVVLMMVYLAWLWSQAHKQYHFFNAKDTERVSGAQKWLFQVEILTLGTLFVFLAFFLFVVLSGSGS